MLARAATGSLFIGMTICLHAHTLKHKVAFENRGFTDSQNCALNDLRPDARTSERKVGQSSAVEPQADLQVMNHMSFLPFTA